ncbi:hypothetical protein Poly24_01190 [Rosistilla carotiformis]|uniref:Uncharacterized protein n=1 Tax=Rosistilla carotiformis TaxID=2528017 RepID=A0A518JLL1_9BACT|nr:hypothetical protein [Rosistilla carotiformis]QDV66433.1 hypothetical protein Poly24_01190 [Rosistilla carotiformis]
MKVQKLIAIAARLLICIVLAPGLATASNGSLEDAINKLSDDIAEFLESQEKASVAIGEFSGPDGGTVGRSIQQRLKENRVAKKIEIRKLGARMKIRGSFSLESQQTFSARLGQYSIFQP